MFKKWWKELWCSHVYRDIERTLIKLRKNEKGEVDTYYAFKQQCMKCGKVQIVELKNEEMHYYE